MSQAEAYQEMHPGLSFEVAARRVGELEEPTAEVPPATPPTAARPAAAAVSTDDLAEEIDGARIALGAALALNPGGEVEAFLRTALESLDEVLSIVADDEEDAG